MSDQITTLRMPNGTEVQFVDWQDMPLYSTADLLSGWSDEEVTLFTYVEGDRVSTTSNATTRRTATKRDTNMATPGSAAGTEEMLVYSIKPEIFELQTDGDPATDVATSAIRAVGQPQPRAINLGRLHDTCTLRLIVSQKIMHEAGFGYYNNGFGTQVQVQGGALIAATRTYASQGFQSQEAVRSFAIPIHVGGTEKYRVVIVNPTGATVNWTDEAATPASVAAIVLKARVYLDGLYKRPVA